MSQRKPANQIGFSFHFKTIFIVIGQGIDLFRVKITILTCQNRIIGTSAVLGFKKLKSLSTRRLIIPQSLANAWIFLESQLIS